MKTINKIMVAVDFSEYSLAAAEYAARLAKDMKAGLLFTNVYNQRDVDMLNTVATRVPNFSVKKYVDEHINERHAGLKNLAKKLRYGKRMAKTHVRIGVPYEALLLEIKDEQPDLLVMGAKGRSNVVDMILGSCAQKMFRHCPIPLMSIRDYPIEAMTTIMSKQKK
jgi:nucleotide-binding universal stress UspA family protein